MNEKVIVTGGAGFIGAALSHYLVSLGLEVLVIDKLHSQVHRSSERPALLSKNVQLVVGDICDGELWDNLLKDIVPTTVIHLAAETGTAQSLSEATRHAHVNVVGTTQMTDAFSRAGVAPDHIILASSRAVYGEGSWLDQTGTLFYPVMRSHEQLKNHDWDFRRNGEIARPQPHSASHTCTNPCSVYGATKLAQEHILSSWAAAKGVPVSVLRLQNVYGPGQSPFNPYTGIINAFHKTAFNGGVIDVYEDGMIGRDFVFIDDVVNVFMAAVAKPPALKRLLDVGTGRARTIMDVAKRIAGIHNAPQPSISGKFRDGDIRWAVADVKDLSDDLGVACRVDIIEEGAFLVGEWLTEKGYMV